MNLEILEDCEGRILLPKDLMTTMHKGLILPLTNLIINFLRQLEEQSIPSWGGRVLSITKQAIVGAWGADGNFGLTARSPRVEQSGHR